MMIMRSNLKIHGAAWAEIQIKFIGKIFDEIIAEKFLDLGKDTDIQIQEAFWTPNRMDGKTSSPYHIICNIPRLETKEIILNAEKD
jgi:hypothetical protein